MIPAAIVYLFVYLGRLVARWYNLGRARDWPVADAVVTGSYEIDENEVSFSGNSWEDPDYENDEYTPRWAVAIQYGYQAEGETYSGTYFLPHTYSDGALASDDVKAWTDKKIVVRYNPGRPEQSFFLAEDGAPGKPHIPRSLSSRPYLTDLSLK